MLSSGAAGFGLVLSFTLAQSNRNHPLLVGLSLVVLELEARTSMPRMMHEVVRAATVFGAFRVNSRMI